MNRCLLTLSVGKRREDVAMARVYKSYAGPDDYIGRVERDGQVYGQRLGPDDYVGRVEENGRIYAAKPGPDQLLGRVEEDGTIYRHIAGGVDINVGRVSQSGKIYVRRPGVAHDALIGRVEGEPQILAGGAAFFLLLDVPE